MKLVRTNKRKYMKKKDSIGSLIMLADAVTMRVVQEKFHVPATLSVPVWKMVGNPLSDLMQRDLTSYISEKTSLREL